MMPLRSPYVEMYVYFSYKIRKPLTNVRYMCPEPLIDAATQQAAGCSQDTQNVTGNQSFLSILELLFFLSNGYGFGHSNIFFLEWPLVKCL